MKQIYIRVDGNEIIATGHVMRCLSIAEQLRKLGIEVIFVVADDRPCELIERQGFRVDVLHTVWDDLDVEIETFTQYLVQKQVNILLLDTYYVTEKYLEQISNYTKVVYIDDLQKFLYPVHALIHYSAFADKQEYIAPYENIGRSVDFLIGGYYAPLRDEFALQPFVVSQEVKKVLITTGGTDQLNVAGNLLEELLGDDICSTLEYHVIVGCFNKNREYLYKLQKQYANVHLHENVTNMSEWMRNCDMAITAAGTTTYELCACGIPSVCLEIADNQEGAVRWEEEGYMRYAGNAYKDMEACVKKCKEVLHLYQNAYEERKEWSGRMQTLIDGYGAKRIAEYIVLQGRKQEEKWVKELNG